MSEFKGLINESWARRLSADYDVLDAHNHRESIKLSKKITFTNLGGLIVRFIDPDNIVTPDELEVLAQQRGVIDLAVNPVRDYFMTFTSEILKSVIDTRGSDNRLATQLANRINPPISLGADPIDIRTVTRYRKDEIWLLPAVEIRILENIKTI